MASKSRQARTMSHLPPKPDFDCTQPARFPSDPRQVVRPAPMAHPPERSYRDRERAYLPPRTPPRERDVYMGSRPRPVDSYRAPASHPPPRDVYIPPPYDRRDDDRYRDTHRDRDYDRKDYPHTADYHRYRPRESSRERDWARDRDRDRDRDTVERERQRRWDEDGRRGYERDRDRRERSPIRERSWSRREDDRWVGRPRTRPEPERTWIPRPSKSPPRQIGKFNITVGSCMRSSLVEFTGSRPPATPASRARSPPSPRRPRSPPSHQRSRPRTPPRTPSRSSPLKEPPSTVFKLGNHSIELSPRNNRDYERSESGRSSRKRYSSRSASPRRRSPMRLPPHRSPSPLRYGPHGRSERHELREHPATNEYPDKPLDRREELREDRHEEKPDAMLQRPLNLPHEVRHEDGQEPQRQKVPEHIPSSRHTSPAPTQPIISSPSPPRHVPEESNFLVITDTQHRPVKQNEVPAPLPTQPKADSMTPKPNIPQKQIPSMPSSMRRRRISRSPPTQPRNFVKTPTTPQSPQVQSPSQGQPTRSEWTNRNSGLSVPTPPLPEQPAATSWSALYVPVIPRYESRPSVVFELEIEVRKLLADYFFFSLSNPYCRLHGYVHTVFI